MEGQKPFDADTPYSASAIVAEAYERAQQTLELVRPVLERHHALLEHFRMPQIAEQLADSFARLSPTMSLLDSGAFHLAAAQIAQISEAAYYTYLKESDFVAPVPAQRVPSCGHSGLEAENAQLRSENKELRRQIRWLQSQSPQDLPHHDPGRPSEN